MHVESMQHGLFLFERSNGKAQDAQARGRYGNLVHSNTKAKGMDSNPRQTENGAAGERRSLWAEIIHNSLIHSCLATAATRNKVCQ